MRIKNVKVYTEDKKFIPGEVSVSGGKFSADPADDGEVLDGEGCYMIPGLVDIHSTDAWGMISVMQKKRALPIWQNMRLLSVSHRSARRQ